MSQGDLLARGAHAMAVCNSCRYCEGYCPVFPAIERRTSFAAADLAQLANLCHNCGECLYACQYAPPHEFGIDVPRLFAELRLRSYEDHCWPRPLGVAFRRQGPATALTLAAVCSALMLGATAALNPGALGARRADAAFYAVVPHAAMVTVGGAVAALVVIALGVGLRRFHHATRGAASVPVSWAAMITALREGATLKHLHASGAHCVGGEDARAPWRRRWHQMTVVGFALSFASTCVAALYHGAFGWEAPYAYTSLPVLLGTAGGLGLVVGPVGQWLEHRRRDPALGDPAQSGGDRAFIVLLWLTSATGLALLALRHRPVMAPLLVVHLGVVLALFVSLPYGKFVHAGYRWMALAQDAAERARPRRH